MKSVIALDLGTSGCKITAIDERGRIIADALEEYPCSFPKKGWSEQNPEDWFNACVKGLKEVVGKIPGYEISALGFSGQMHGLVALDEGCKVIRPAILWNDQRTAKQCDEITETAGGTDSLVKLTGNRTMTGFTAGKILWMRENEPENFSAIRHILNPKDYIRLRLTGEFITDVSEASGTGLYDVPARTFSAELLELLGLSEELLPEVRESTDPAGYITEQAAALTGLPVGLVCSAGGGDAVISTTGLGLVKDGLVGITVGTSGVVAMGLSNPVENTMGRMQLSAGNAPGKWHIMGAMLSAAGAYSWFADTLGGEEKIISEKIGKNVFALLDSEAEKVPPASDGLLFLPYLIGERCPVYDPDALGGFFGLNMLHTKGHFARSVMEGVAFALRQIYDEMTGLCGVCPSEIVLAGGGASSPLWRRIFAGVFNLPVYTVSGSRQGGSFAAALVASVTAGIFPSLDEAMNTVKVLTRDFPDENDVKLYAEGYEKYKRLYGSMKWLWEKQ